MIRSMTGFGKHTLEITGKQISIEVRSLNSKQGEINLRLPSRLRELETEIRARVQQVLERGKLDISIIYSSHSPANQLPTVAQIKEQIDYLREVEAQAGLEPAAYLEIIFNHPELFFSQNNDLSNAEATQILNGVETAALHADTFRIQEGKAIATELRTRLQNLREQMKHVEALEGERLAGARERLHKKLEEWAVDKLIDENRFEQEIIYYLEKLDISEEKQRLTNHFLFFEESMEQSEASGRKLQFITQEIGREINTIGSKANHAALQKLVVVMKDELEKIKEQLNNVL